MLLTIVFTVFKIRILCLIIQCILQRIDINLNFNVSLAHAAAGRPYKAIDVMKVVEETSPADVRPKKMLVRYYAQLGLYAEALEKIREVEALTFIDREVERVIKELEAIIKNTQEEITPER